MGESTVFHLRGVGDSEERTSSTIVFPFRPTGVDTTPICDEADEEMDDEYCMPFVIRSLFFYCCV